uniref:Uncharacterized protein n=1 Tax=Panagrolaimus sp. PS1159 TaxID=55785 RepID=A0AC35ERP1_9BILA
MGDLYEPLAPMGSQPPPPPPPSAPELSKETKDDKLSKEGKESKVFSDNVAGNTAMSAITDTQFGGADGQSAYSLQADTAGKTKKKNDGGSADSGGRKRTRGACICMIVSGLFGTLSLGSAIGGAVALFMQ